MRGARGGRGGGAKGTEVAAQRVGLETSADALLEANRRALAVQVDAPWNAYLRPQGDGWGQRGGALWFGKIIPKRDFVREGVPNKKTREESVWGSGIGGAVDQECDSFTCDEAR